jgi:hypothetical protein
VIHTDDPHTRGTSDQAFINRKSAKIKPTELRPSRLTSLDPEGKQKLLVKCLHSEDGQGSAHAGGGERSE